MNSGWRAITLFRIYYLQYAFQEDANIATNYLPVALREYRTLSLISVWSWGCEADENCALGEYVILNGRKRQEAG
jgi:hypothetical protein